MSHPCTSPVSVFQCRLLASPHSGRKAALRCVICFQSPIAPAHTSGGLEYDSRTTAVVLPSLEKETEGSKMPNGSDSGAVQIGVIFWSVSTRAMKVCPPSIPVTITPDESGAQLIAVAENFESGVRLRGAPPVTGTVKTSPPGIGSSL